MSNNINEMISEFQKQDSSEVNQAVDLSKLPKDYEPLRLSLNINTLLVNIVNEFD